MPIPPSSIAFPSSLDSFVAAAPGDSRNNPSLSTFVTQLGDAIEALEAKVGVNSSAVSSTLDYKMTHHDHSTGAQVPWASGISGKPATFAPAAHGLLDAGYHTGISSGFPPSAHGYSVHSSAFAEMPKGADQNIPDTNDTLVTWTTASYDPNGFADPTNEMMSPPNNTIVRVTARLMFAGNGNGSRRAWLTRSGTEVDRAQCAPASTGNTTLWLQWEGPVSLNANFKVYAWQNSGSGLSLVATNCRFQLVVLASA